MPVGRDDFQCVPWSTEWSGQMKYASDLIGLNISAIFSMIYDKKH